MDWPAWVVFLQLSADAIRLMSPPRFHFRTPPHHLLIGARDCRRRDWHVLLVAQDKLALCEGPECSCVPLLLIWVGNAVRMQAARDQAIGGPVHDALAGFSDLALSLIHISEPTRQAEI